jgi:carbonic anhydrase/acetyltransferase-like protein (isoleucine patch superfamily)
MTFYTLDGRAPDFADRASVYVAPGAHVIGQVRLGRDASVWFGAVLRGDNDLIAIGDRSNVQDNAVVHADAGVPVTIGADCAIGHRAIVHGATVGDGTLVGMGATLLNRAVIGRNCLIGANALVTEGKSFPDGALIVGAPARLVRMLSDTEIAALKVSADIYVANARRFRAGLDAA